MTEGISFVSLVQISMRRSGGFMTVEAGRTAHRPAGRRLAIDARPAGIADHAIRAPVTRTHSIQEMHIVIRHMLCGFIEEALC